MGTSKSQIDTPPRSRPQRADDESAAVGALREVLRRAVELGLRARWVGEGLEVLPPVNANKGAAARALLSARGLQQGLYVGDDSTTSRPSAA